MGTAAISPHHPPFTTSIQKATDSILRFGMYIANLRMGIPKFRISIRFFSIVRPDPSLSSAAISVNPEEAKAMGDTLLAP